MAGRYAFKMMYSNCCSVAMKYVRIVFLVWMLLSGYNSLKGLKVFKATIFVKEEVKTKIQKSSFLLRFYA